MGDNRNIRLARAWCLGELRRIGAALMDGSWVDGGGPCEPARLSLSDALSVMGHAASQMLRKGAREVVAAAAIIEQLRGDLDG
jgi:hypothetical protein